jgi:hypothetical protein
MSLRMCFKGLICTNERVHGNKVNLHYSHLDHTWKNKLNLRDSNYDVVCCRSDTGQITTGAADP